MSITRTHEIEEKYYADGEDAFAMRKQLKEVNAVSTSTAITKEPAKKLQTRKLHEKGILFFAHLFSNLQQRSKKF